jgi:hypothetical protein
MAERVAETAESQSTEYDAYATALQQVDDAASLLDLSPGLQGILR